MRIRTGVSAERVSAAAYGTVLILAALPFINPDDVAVAQLVALGAYVGSVAGERASDRWVYAGVTALFGLAVVVTKLALGH